MKFRILTLLNMLLVAAAVLPIGTSAAIAYALFVDSSLESSRTRLEAVSSYLANNASEQVEAAHLLVSHVADLAAKHPDVVPTSLQSAVEFDEKLRLAYILDKDLKSEAVYFSKEIKRNPENFIGIDMSSDPAAVRAKMSGKTSWSPSYLSTVDGTPVISLAVPSGDKILLAQVDLSVLRKLSDRLPSYPNTIAAIVDSQGTVMYSTVKEMAVQRQNLWYSKALQSALKGGHGAVLEKIEGADSVVGYTSIPHTGWAILVWEPRTVALERTLETVRLMTLMAALAAALASVLSFFASKRLIRPLDSLIATTEGIAKGEPIDPPRQSRIHEVGKLAEAVYHMGLKIREREAQLIESNKALQESEFRYRRFLDTAQEAIWALDADGLTSYVNPALCTLLGYPPEEIVGRRSEDFVEPGEREEHLLMLEKRRRGESGDYLQTFIAKNGRRVYTRVLASPILDGQGNFAGAIATMSDVTAIIQQEEERRQHEAQVRELLERLQQQFDAMPTPCFSLDSEGRLVDVNPAGERLFGVQKAAAVGKDLPSWFENTQSRSRFTAWLMDDSFSGPALFTHMIDGHEVHCEWFKSAIASASGEEIGILAMAQNISEKLEAESKIRRFNIELEQKVAQRTRELEESNRELESFSYSVSHDLRSPLRAIDGYASMLVSDYRDVLNEDAQECLDRIRKNTQRMGNLISDLLTLSRLGRQALNLEDIDLAEAAREAWKELSTTNNLDAFDFQVEPNLRVRADYSLMKQVMLNLLSNAVKYTAERPSPQVKIGSFTSNGTAGFYVEDNGVGFDMAYAPKIFEVFQRAHSSHEYEGTGVGLAIVQRVIKKHQGDVWVRSEPGKGTTFFFTVGNKLAES